MTIWLPSGEKPTPLVIPRSVSQSAIGVNVGSSYNQSPIHDPTAKYCPSGENAISPALLRPNRAIAPSGSAHVVTSSPSILRSARAGEFLFSIKNLLRNARDLCFTDVVCSYYLEGTLYKTVDEKNRVGEK